MANKESKEEMKTKSIQLARTNFGNYVAQIKDQQITEKMLTIYTELPADLDRQQLPTAIAAAKALLATPASEGEVDMLLSQFAAGSKWPSTIHDPSMAMSLLHEVLVKARFPAILIRTALLRVLCKNEWISIPAVVQECEAVRDEFKGAIYYCSLSPQDQYVVRYQIDLLGKTKAQLLRERKRYIHIPKVWDDEDDPRTDD